MAADGKDGMGACGKKRIYNLDIRIRDLLRISAVKLLS
jgi:hypothetical protein